MTRDDLIAQERQALNLLAAYEAGSLMNLSDEPAGDLNNQHTEQSIVVLRSRIAELQRRIAGHPDAGDKN
ncbi:hypothetical protein [Sphingomonas glaciei]|uniref:Uncharacterized protein n=1 Tax=Sphingomonas glaciei TaxID=2938948 RepID=A0ABY5MQQ8_9SPHN|nr:hypothetical protein [Sphingomonas glaciei]UUR06732.1 hypothetical protein M1K48_07115 [Sphingomonas glaciei]